MSALHSSPSGLDTTESPEKQITELRAALLAERRARIDAEDQLDALSRAVPDIVWKGHPDGSIESLDGRGLELIGLEVGQLHGQNWHALVHPDDLPSALSRWQNSLRSGEPYELEHRLRHADGRYVRYLVRASAQRDEQGAILRWCGSCVALPKRAESGRDVLPIRPLQRDASQRIIDSLPGIFYMFDEKGRFSRWNENFLKVTGYSASEVVRMRPLEFFCEAERELIASRIQLTFRRGEAEMEARLRLKDGTTLPYFFAARLLDVEGQLFLSSVGIDMTARVRTDTREQKLESQARQSQNLESVGRLAAGVAHGFNNILTVQRAHLAFIAECPELSADLQTHLERISEAGERAASLTRQLMLFSRKRPLCLQVLRLDEFVSRFAAKIRPTLGDRIALEVTLQPGTVRVNADETLLEQALMNLAVNARDAMHEGGRLNIDVGTITLESRDGAAIPAGTSLEFARLAVTDTGVGISPEHQEHIFEPFFTTKPAGEGTGLGLAAVHGIIQQHGGWVELTSSPAAGATFSIYLPQVTRASKATSSVPNRLPLAKGETILLVEDERSLRTIITQLLEVRGYRVLAAESGRAALEIWARERDSIQLLLTDMVMAGGMSGGDVLARLRADNPKLKAILSSGYTAEVLSEAQIGDNTCFLAKPYLPEHLHAMIRELLARTA